MTYRIEDLRSTTIFSVAIYEVDRAYGGPEEGGWWFDTGEIVQRCRIRQFRDEEEAFACCRRINRLLHHLRETHPQPYGLSSVCYSGGHYAAEVHEGLPPARYPEERPFYE